MKQSGSVVVVLFVFLAFLVSSADALCVKVTRANLRSGPGTKYDKTWTVYQYMPFTKMKGYGNWYKVRDVDGDVHWIFAKLVTDKYLCGVVKNDNTNIRTGPGTRYRQTGFSPIDKYYSFRVLQKKGRWVKIRDMDGDTGWIYDSLIWVQ